MILFKRKKPAQAVLPEIEKYYDAEKRERAGLAWLLALTSVAVVTLMLIGAFFGGRWVYRKVTNTNKTPGVTITDTNNVDGNIGKSQDTNTANAGNVFVETPSTTPANPTSSTTPVVATSSNTTASANKELTNTGPANTVAIFIVSVLGFSALHYFVSASRRAN